MKSARTVARMSAAVAGLVFLVGSIARGDSLATTDGKILVGTVTKTSTGYSIQTETGTVEVPARDVRKILWDHPPIDESPAAAVPVVPAAPVKDPVMLRSLIAQGKLAMANGQYSDARDAFADAMALDETNAVAGRGLGFAYLKIGEPAKAAPPLEVAALSQQSPDRTLTIGLAASQVAAHDPARAVKWLSAYLDAHPQPLDEPVINALGIALAQFKPPADRGQVYLEGNGLYEKLVASLEDARPNEKRWGIDWLPAEDANKKLKDYSDAKAKVDDAAAKLQAANSKLTKAQDEVGDATDSTAHRAVRDAKLSAAKSRLSCATDSLKDAQSKFDQANQQFAAVPAPDYPQQILLQGVDFSMQREATAAPATISGGSAALPVAVKPTVTPPASVSNPHDAISADPDKEPPRDAVAFAIAPDVLVTASSAVEDATDITITTSLGKTARAKVLRDHHGDGIALLKVDGLDLPYLALAASYQPNPATTLNCLGFPVVDYFNPLARVMTATPQKSPDHLTLRFDQSPRLPGAPLLAENAVVGVELGDRDSELAAVPAASLEALSSLAKGLTGKKKSTDDPKAAVVQVHAQR